MLRGHIHRDGVAMADHGVDQPFLNAPLTQNLLLLDAVLLRILLKIQIMQQPHQAPELFLIAIAQLPGEIAHHALNNLGVLQMKGVLIVFCQQCPGFISRHVPMFLSPCNVASNQCSRLYTY